MAVRNVLGSSDYTLGSDLILLLVRAGVPRACASDKHQKVRILYLSVF
jgi:hypothetical protein